MADQPDFGASSSPSSSATVNVQQIKTQISQKLSAHRPLVLKLNSVLTWEQDFYPVIVFASVSALFLLIFFMNSSVLTTVSYLGIGFTLLDMLLPTISKTLTGGQNKLTEKDNAQFDKVCNELANLNAKFKEYSSKLCALKTSSPKKYYLGLLGCLLIFAFLGNMINNLFLTYLISLFVALSPGLTKRGHLDSILAFVNAKLGRSGPSAASSGAGDRRGSGKRN